LPAAAGHPLWPRPSACLKPPSVIPRLTCRFVELVQVVGFPLPKP